MRRSQRAATCLLTLGALGLSSATAQTVSDQPGVFGETIEVRVVNLEVVVTDKDGNRVNGLQPDLFRLLVDGEEVPIQYFTEIRSGVAMEQAGVPEGMELAPGLAVGEPVGTSYLIFIDEFFSIARDRDIVVDRLIENVTTMGPSDRAAVVAFTGTELEMLSSWTQSVDELQEVLKTAKGRSAKGLQRLAERNRFDDTNRVVTASLAVREAENQFTLDTYLDPEERFYASMLSGQVERAVNAASASLRSFARPPGRKVMLLASGGWPFLPAEFVVSDVRRPIFDTRVPGGGELFRPLTETANRLGYTLYPIDVPGFDRSPGEISGELPLTDNGRVDPRPGLGSNSAFVREQEAHYTLQFLAEETGGRAFINSGRLEAFEGVRSDTRSYYWLGFTPEWQGDDSYHDVQVELTDPSLRVRTRSGYLDMSRALETSMEVESALLFGSPPTEEPLALRFGRPEKGGFRKMTVPLSIDIPMDKLTFLATAEGGQRASLEVRVAVIDKTGAQAEIPVIPLVITLPQLPPRGEVFIYDLDLKMRRERHRAVVAVYDQASGSMLSGTAEVSP
jgi:VWFA-related protein